MDLPHRQDVDADRRADRAAAPVFAARDPQELRVHPAFLELGLHRHGEGAPAPRGDDSATLPVVVSASGIVIDGIDRWRRACDDDARSISCLVYDVPEPVALAMLIEGSLRRLTLNAFCRIELALRMHRVSDGATFTGWPGAASSKLTKGTGRDRRREIAALANVSAGNVTKVSQILEAAAPEVVRALRHGSISINRAWLIRGLSPRRQREALAAGRQRATIDRKVDQLLERQLQARSTLETIRPEEGIRLLRRLGLDVPEDTRVVVAETPGMIVAISRGIREWLDSAVETV